MRHYKIAAIPGDGIGQEVIPAGLEVLHALQRQDGGFELDIQEFPWGTDYYHRTGLMMPDDGLEVLKRFDAIYFGAVGHPTVPDHLTLWGLRLRICQGFDQYANVRPTRVLPGLVSPLRHVNSGELDWVIVRENSEGEYSGHGGREPSDGRHRNRNTHRRTPSRSRRHRYHGTSYRSGLPGDFAAGLPIAFVV